MERAKTGDLYLCDERDMTVTIEKAGTYAACGTVC